MPKLVLIYKINLILTALENNVLKAQGGSVIRPHLPILHSSAAQVCPYRCP